jgi:hypothetical protein
VLLFPGLLKHPEELEVSIYNMINVSCNVTSSEQHANGTSGNAANGGQNGEEGCCTYNAGADLTDYVR